MVTGCLFISTRSSAGKCALFKSEAMAKADLNLMYHYCGLYSSLQSDTPRSPWGPVVYIKFHILESWLPASALNSVVVLYHSAVTVVIGFIPSLLHLRVIQAVEYLFSLNSHLRMI